jgi:hypothetical protein
MVATKTNEAPRNRQRPTPRAERQPLHLGQNASPYTSTRDAGLYTSTRDAGLYTSTRDAGLYTSARDAGLARAHDPGTRETAERIASKLALAVSVSSPTPQVVSSPMLNLT